MTQLDPTLRGLVKPFCAMTQPERSTFLARVRKERATRPPTAPRAAKARARPAPRTSKQTKTLVSQLSRLSPAKLSALLKSAQSGDTA